MEQLNLPQPSVPPGRRGAAAQPRSPAQPSSAAQPCSPAQLCSPAQQAPRAGQGPGCWTCPKPVAEALLAQCKEAVSMHVLGV